MATTEKMAVALRVLTAINFHQTQKSAMYYCYAGIVQIIPT